METEIYKGQQHLATGLHQSHHTSSTRFYRSSTLLRRITLASALLVLYATFRIVSMPSTDIDLSDYTQSISLPFIYKLSPKHVPQVWCTVAGNRIPMPVDTGSTGILVSAPLLPNVGSEVGESAHHFFTSSRILYVGRLVKLAITFEGEAGTSATAAVPVLVVDNSWLCPWYNPSRDTFECPPGPNGEEAIRRDNRTTYMGVGFGRNCPRDGMPIAAPSVNPFLNIDHVNGCPVDDTSMRTGYEVSSTGIIIGLTTQNSRGYTFQKLEPGCTHDQDERDWAMAKMTLKVNDEPNCHGDVLVDTGIAHSYIKVDEGVLVPNVTIPNPNPKGYAKNVRRVKSGTRVAVGFPLLDQMTPSYSFVSGGGSFIEPTFIVPDRATDRAFVNTGRNVLFRHSIAFDAVGGRFGIREASSTASSFL